MSEPIEIVVTPSTSDASTPAAPCEKVPSQDLCLACKKNPIEYCSSTCRHRLYCKRCAMKCATGGKCKVCGELFPDLRRV